MFDEAELRDEVVVVFVAGVYVGLCSHTANHIKVVDVHVDKDSEKSAKDLLAHLLEIFWEGNTLKQKGISCYICKNKTKQINEKKNVCITSVINV